MYKSIVVGTDGSDSAAVAVAHATELAARFDAMLHLVSVGRPLPRSAVAEMAPDDLIGDATTVLYRASESARAKGVRVETHAVTGAPAQVLVEMAEKLSADVLVVGNRGMIGARRFLGSVPNSVAHHAPCSVLIVATTNATS